MTSLIGYRNFSVLCTCHVYIIFVNVYFLDLYSLCEIVKFQFPNVFIGSSTKKFGNKLIVFEIAKTKNVMMSSVLSNILG